MGLKHTFQNKIARLPDIVFESPQWRAFVDRHTEDRKFRYLTRAAGVGLIATSAWLGYKGMDTALVQMGESQPNLDTQRYALLGGALASIALGVPLTLFNKLKEPLPSLAEQDARGQPDWQPVLRPDLIGRLSVGQLELEAALIYHDADELGIRAVEAATQMVDKIPEQL